MSLAGTPLNYLHWMVSVQVSIPGALIQNKDIFSEFYTLFANRKLPIYSFNKLDHHFCSISFLIAVVNTLFLHNRSWE